MTAGNLIICMVAMLLPYCFFLQFNPPYDLKISTQGIVGLTAKLCKAIWPLIFTTSIISVTAVLTWMAGLNEISVGLGAFALFLYALLFIPGIVAYKHVHNLNKKS